MKDRIKKYDEKKYSELQYVAKFTDCYNAGDYKAAQNALTQLETQFSNSKYIKMIKNEYPDLDDKLREQRSEQRSEQKRERKKKGEYMTSAQRHDMVEGMLYVMDNIIKNDIDDDGIYAAFSYNSIGQLVIYVDDNKWDGLSPDQKISFITELGNYYDDTVRPQLLEYANPSKTLYFRSFRSGLTQGSWNSSLDPKYDYRK